MDPLLLRFFERFIVVLIGGMAIYLGFRLFLEVPEHRDGAGKVTLPWDTSIIMTRIGPGVFFALFGTIVIGLSLIKPLEIKPLEINSQGGNYVSYMGKRTLSDQSNRADARALLRREIAELNTIPQLLRADLPEYERDSIKRSIARVKFLLIKPAWGDSNEGFGDIAEFKRWIDAGEPDPPPAGIEEALSLYRYGTKEPRP